MITIDVHYENISNFIDCSVRFTTEFVFTFKLILLYLYVKMPKSLFLFIFNALFVKLA